MLELQPSQVFAADKALYCFAGHVGRTSSRLLNCLCIALFSLTIVPRRGGIRKPTLGILFKDGERLSITIAVAYVVNSHHARTLVDFEWKGQMHTNVRSRSM